MAREIIVGHWKSPEVLARLSSWMRTAIGVVESGKTRVCRFADNMMGVAVTEGDKVEAAIKFGWTVDTYPIGQIVEYVDAAPKKQVDGLVGEYCSKYQILAEGRNLSEFRASLRTQAAIEIGFEKFLSERGYNAVVTHFGDLGRLRQLPGLAIQRLMEKGYGFGAEGDWKTAAMVRLMKLMSGNRGTSFFEDYTYNLVPGSEAVLESHMLEVCPSVAEGNIQILIRPLSMGNREDPPRLVFSCPPGRGIAVSLVDLGHRFRLVINEVECLEFPEKMPRLPVAAAYWRPLPNLQDSAAAWILAGGAHHTAFSYRLTSAQMELWAESMGIESIVIDKDTEIRSFKEKLRWNEAYFRK